MSGWLSRRLVLLFLKRIKTGSLIAVEGDERLVFGSGSPTATVQIASQRTWRMLLRGSRGMAAAFAQGLWDSPDLVALIRVAARNAGGLDRLRSLSAPVRWPPQRAPALGMTLEHAQVAKLKRICEQLDLAPGGRALEIGTGWGAFAPHAAAARGCHVTTTTISREQHDYAFEQVRRTGLTERVKVLKEDYCEPQRRPVLARGDRPQPGPANRPAGGGARGPDAALRRDAPALAPELHGSLSA